MIPGKTADLKSQQQFVKGYAQARQQSESGKSYVLFFNGMHLLHNTHIGKSWQVRGQSGTLVLPSNTERHRISILLALDSLDYRITNLIINGRVDKDVIKVF